jgi:hypothetical protein
MEGRGGGKAQGVADPPKICAYPMEPKLNRYDKDNELIECENDLII